MAKEELRNRKLNTPLGVFSQATKIEANGTLVFVSGLTSRDPDGKVVGVGDVKKQTETILENMQTILADAGGTLDDVMKVTVYIRNMKDFDAIHEVRRRYFKAPLPASTMVEVSMLVSPELLIEIEAFAVIPSK
ncbi:MAG: enamine deaminase RidA [Sulfobacillus benefaciens]|uniref:Enamine deaminase RidA n=1 Tax=Sulfobacillus benefaciens TaxID=453960 RepID=A0A2T2XJ47_9FIRM|nr:MAG: enamine deaminase RidA [Sulfobacillus benefaciens]